MDDLIADFADNLPCPACIERGPIVVFEDDEEPPTHCEVCGVEYQTFTFWFEGLDDRYLPEESNETWELSGGD